MNPQQIQSIVRAFLQVILAPGSYLVLHGILPADAAQQLVVPLTSIITVVGGILLARWGVAAHSPSAAVTLINSADVPGVKVVAESSPSPKVTVNKNGTVQTLPLQ